MTDHNVIMINKDLYDSLIEDTRFLNALQTAGVDNWDGYDYALEILEGMDEPNE